QLRKALHDRPVGRFRVRVILLVFGDAEVRPIEELLEADDLRAVSGGVPGELLMLVEHGLFVAGPSGLSDCRANNIGHRGFSTLLRASPCELLLRLRLCRDDLLLTDMNI